MYNEFYIMSDEKHIQSGELTYLTDMPARCPETGLIEDTGEYDSDVESHRRQQATDLANYAENGIHFDPAGKYLCGGVAGDGIGGCNQYRPASHQCLSVAGHIDGDCGSCRWWEDYDPDRSSLLMDPEKFLKGAAEYGEREPGGTGFGCHQCEYGSEAKAADGDRSLFCGIWGARVLPNACCGRNHKLGDKLFKDNRPLTQIEIY